MSSDNRQPFIDSRAFDKVNSTYVMFPSQSDAMLASLQLFHDVPCRIMNRVFSMVTHPDFDAKQVTLRNSVDVIDVVEETRLKDRMAVVQARSASEDGRVEQAGFPHFILDEVLDIIHAERMSSIKARFEETLDEKAMYCKSMHIEEDNTLKAMTVVHRSWTTLAQKALGRALHIGRPIHEMNVLLSPVQKSIFGPWTSAVAVQFFDHVEQKEAHYCERCEHWDRLEHQCDIDGFRYECAEVIDKEECRQWFEMLHRILVGFTNLKSLYIKSYSLLCTEWLNLTFGEMVRRNVRLEEVTLYTYTIDIETFNLDPLLENAAVLKNLRNLSIEGAWISNVTVQKAMQEPGFACLSNVTIKWCFTSLESDLALLSIFSSQSNSRLKSLRIVDPHRRTTSFEEYLERTFTPQQTAAIFGHLRSLHIHSTTAEEWFNWIGPYCLSLESLTIIGGSNERQPFEEAIRRASSSPQSVIVFDRLRTLHINSGEAADHWLKWIGPSCSSLESLSIIGGINERQSFEEAVRRASSSPQSVIVFDRLSTLYINSGEAVDLWLKWIGPSCSGLQSLTLITSLTQTPDTLNLIPVTIRSLDVSLWTKWNTTFEEITAWMKWLLKIASSMHFPKLKSFTLSISEGYIPDVYGGTSRWESAQKFRRRLPQKFRATEMQDFKAKMSAACEGDGVKCCLNF